VELHGDRGALVGNPELVPEHGAQADLGVRVARGPASAELVGFHARYRDLVAWEQGPSGVSRPENIGRADVSGLEAALGGEWGALELQATTTVLRAIERSDDPTYDGNQLPRVPIAEAFLLAGVRAGGLRLAGDVTFPAGTYANRANFLLQPPRTLLGATAQVSDRSGRLRAELDVRNLLDTLAVDVPANPLEPGGLETPQAMVDFTGYPLPGRTVLLSVVFEP
jgi:outer membrane receptor protein involved in Fe transport